MDGNCIWSYTRLNIEATIHDLFWLTYSLSINIDNASYVDDNVSYIVVDNIDDLDKPLEEASTALFQCFDDNLLKSNPEKCHFLISSNENI